MLVLSPIAIGVSEFCLVSISEVFRLKRDSLLACTRPPTLVYCYEKEKYVRPPLHPSHCLEWLEWGAGPGVIVYIAYAGTIVADSWTDVI